ncbi:concentrative nucleoside transporter 2 [Halictus rubicundus]|uniref:concentrative nucleoside transporter 2 n=1 Tax=Halictus rubicundus TaxID=77578 RepID=UPI004034FEFF
MGTANPAFEDNELSILEAGKRYDDPVQDKATRKEDESDGCLAAGYHALSAFLSKHRRIVRIVCWLTFNVLLLIYFVFATLYWKNHHFEEGFDWCHGYGLLLLLFAIGYFGVLYHHAAKRFGKKIGRGVSPLGKRLKNFRNTRYGGTVCRSVIFICIFAAIIVFLILDTVDSRERLTSAVGVVTLMCFGWIFSKHPGRINWKPVLCGLILQFLFGLFTIRWDVGRAICQCMSDKVAAFLNFAKSGSEFIFGKQLVGDGVFAFAVLPVIFYFSFFIQMLYYAGVMQWIILNIGRILQALMSTSICESLNCSANIFIGMTESPLLIKPYLNKLTSSELHAIMCSGFATVSGTVLAAYIEFGANPAHLITASLMAAPAALCYSKLFYPETEEILITRENVKLQKSQDNSLMDAASKGAMAAIPLVLGIIANIVAFVSFISLINSLLGWLGVLVGYDSANFGEPLSLEFILSKVFKPLSWIMGVPWEDCEKVATLIGLKTVVNEFVAYQKLGEFKRQGKLFGRTEAIATFAICGFANPGSVGITLGVLSSLAPERKKQITDAVMRAFVAGSAVCFLTASIAGLLVTDGAFGNAPNSTVSTMLAANATGTLVS